MTNILLVDDNVDLVENIAELLRDEGHAAVIFTHPFEALTCFQPSTYGIAILDCKMPEIDGVELFRRLRQRDPQLPAILVTAYASDECLQAAAAVGIKEVISKPIELRSFVKLVSTLLRDK